MGQSKIVTIWPVFILSDVFLAVAVVIAKAPWRIYNSNCNENVTLNYNLLLSAMRLFYVGLLYKIGEMTLHFIVIIGFHVGRGEWKIYCWRF